MNVINRLVRRLGEKIGEYDENETWHFRKERNGCYYERKWDCCHACFWRFTRYDVRLRREMQGRDPYPDADDSEPTTIEVNSPEGGQ
jgi:hypothetical protein